MIAGGRPHRRTSRRGAGKRRLHGGDGCAAQRPVPWSCGLRARFVPRRSVCGSPGPWAVASPVPDFLGGTGPLASRLSCRGRMVDLCGPSGPTLNNSRAAMATDPQKRGIDARTVLARRRTRGGTRTCTIGPTRTARLSDWPVGPHVFVPGEAFRPPLPRLANVSDVLSTANSPRAPRQDGSGKEGFLGQCARRQGRIRTVAGCFGAGPSIRLRDRALSIRNPDLYWAPQRPLFVSFELR